MKIFSHLRYFIKSVCLWYVLFLLIACSKPENLADFAVEVPGLVQRSCATDESFDKFIQANPSVMAIRNAIEVQAGNFLKNRGKQGRSIGLDGNITIPVVVHVIYNQSGDNVSLQQIQSQIDVLNQDFNATNTDFSSIPSIFQSVAANFQISFVLKSVDRRSSTQAEWDAGSGLYKSFATGGLDVVSPENTLNIWVCRMTNMILGYGPYPGSVSQQMDGITVSPICFGTTGVSLIANYDAGRTATHEVGHWLNLIHIWGNEHCGDDKVDDTPTHTNANYYCPNFPFNSTCTGQSLPQMTMNYMDYTYDRCLFMFTLGQKARARALFESNGYRNGFVMPTLLTISGPSSLCPSTSATYTINNVPAGATVTWDPNIGSLGSVVSVSGNSITITGSGVGAGSLGATIVDPGYAFTVNTIRISFGTTVPGGITSTTGPTIGCERMKLEIAVVPGATSYKWTIDGSVQTGITTRSFTRIIEADGVDHLVEVQAIGPCGISAKRSKTVTGWCGT